MEVSKNKRPPIVVVMGHVDHGKTTLLDYIRKSTVASREAGGITQSIGAYEIVHSSTGSTNSPQASSGQAEKITFIDTPGHEAFSKMRTRGANIADIALLVVAADDGVQPQTKEAFQIIQKEKVPFIVVINKIDRGNIDLNRVKNDLAVAGVMLEGSGGTVPCQAVSAKTGEGVPELLDLILLNAEVENLTYQKDAPGKGYVLEAHMDNRRGIAASIIMKDGVLRVGDFIRAGLVSGKVRTIEDFLRASVQEVQPSSPALVLGFEALPKVGDEFIAQRGTPFAEAEKAAAKSAPIPQIKNDDTTIYLILKADVGGSIEVLSEIIKALPRPEETKIIVVDESVGDISESDAKLAISTKAVLVGFRVKIAKGAENLIRAHNLKVVRSEIVYELIRFIEEEIIKLKKNVVKGDLEILAVFGQKGPKAQIVGGRVVLGTVPNRSAVEIHRRDAQVGEGKIQNTQKDRHDVAALEAGEGGLLIDSETPIKVGDHLIVR